MSVVSFYEMFKGQKIRLVCWFPLCQQKQIISVDDSVFPGLKQM